MPTRREITDLPTFATTSVLTDEAMAKRGIDSITRELIRKDVVAEAARIFINAPHGMLPSPDVMDEVFQRQAL